MQMEQIRIAPELRLCRRKAGAQPFLSFCTNFKRLWKSHEKTNIKQENISFVLQVEPFSNHQNSWQ